MDPFEYLLGLQALGMKFGLENIRRLCSALGHPEETFQSIVVAGTNGKGSVTAMLGTALTAAGYRTGRYTSPHLERLEERFALSGREAATSEVRDAAGIVQRTVQALVAQRILEEPPTFFEFATATAFELFRKAGVEIAVLEVGLGGRLDATNVVTPLAAVITTIALDHVAQLGDSLTSVAREKAGVIKPGIPVVCGRLPPEAEAVMVETCTAQGARFIRASDVVRWSADVEDGRTLVTLETRRHAFTRVPIVLQGRHQAQNAVTAVALLEELMDLGVRLDERHIRSGLTEVVWPGRLEQFRFGDAHVLLDAAHNPAGARALADYLVEAGWTNAVLVFGVMRDKDVRGMLAALLPVVRGIICTAAPSPRALPARQLGAMARDAAADYTGLDPVEALDDPIEAFRRACASSHRVVVAGSIFLLGPVRGILR